MKLSIGQKLIGIKDMPPLITKGETYVVSTLDDTWKTFSFYGNNWKMTVLEQDRVDIYFDVGAPVSIQTETTICTCGAQHVQGKHSSWCDSELLKT